MNLSRKFLIIALMHTLGGCQCEDIINGDEEEITSEGLTEVVTRTSNTPEKRSPWDTSTSKTSGAFLLTPEQFSQQLESSLDYEPGWENADGSFTNVVTDFLAVPLGGVDFDSRSIRDRNPKVQTQLIIRQVSWDAAISIVWRDVDPNNSDSQRRDRSPVQGAAPSFLNLITLIFAVPNQSPLRSYRYGDH